MVALQTWSMPASAQEPQAELVVEGGEPSRVPVQPLVERLRAELPGVRVVAGGPRATGAPRTVTLGISPAGQILIVYRDAAGTQTTRIVADSHDPQAMAATIAMVIANLHDDQVDATLATLTPPVPVAPPLAIPTPVVVSAAVVARPVQGPQPRARAQVQPAGPERQERMRFSVALSPFVNLVPRVEQMLGVSLNAQLRWSRWSLGLVASTMPSIDTLNEEVLVGGSDPRSMVTGYAQHTGSAILRRLLVATDRIELGVGLGLGWRIAEYDDADGSSYLDALFTGGGALDVRLLGDFWWASTVDLAVPTDGGPTFYRPYNPWAWLTVATGVRYTL